MSAWLYRRLRELGYVSYEDYLASTHWQNTRQRFKGRDARCLICRSRRIELHHRTYERIGEELDEDLVPLCRRCHDQVHRKLMSVPGLVLHDAHEWVLEQQRAKRLRYEPSPELMASRAKKARDVGIRQLKATPKQAKRKRPKRKRKQA